MAQKFLNGISVLSSAIIDGSSLADGSSVLDVQGTQGQLFSVTDNLTGDLFSVSDVSGIPILNVDSSGLITIDGNLNLGDSNKIQLGASQDLQIYHDGSNSYISEVGTGDLIISADNDLTFKDGSGNTMANMNASNSVELMYGNVKKFETTSTGVTVSGKISAITASGHAFLLGNSNNTTTADTSGFRLHQSSYTDGRYTHRFRKYDEGGGVPLYIDGSGSTANVFTALARFGTYTNEDKAFEVFGKAKATHFYGDGSNLTNVPVGTHNHDGDYIQDGGTTAIGNMNTIGTESIKHRWNSATTGRPASSQANEYGTVTTLTYDSSYATQLAWDIDQGNLYGRTLTLANDSGTWVKFAKDGDYVPASGGTFAGGVVNVNTNSNTNTLNISRSGGNSSQVMKIGVHDTVATFNYIEDTTNEGNGNFGQYQFNLGGNDGESTVTALTITKTGISAPNLSGTNTGDQVLPTDFVSAANGGTFGGNVTIKHPSSPSLTLTDDSPDPDNIGKIDVANAYMTFALDSSDGIDSSRMRFQLDGSNIVEILPNTTYFRQTNLHLQNTNVSNINFRRDAAITAGEDIGKINFHSTNDEGTSYTTGGNIIYEGDGTWDLSSINNAPTRMKIQLRNSSGALQNAMMLSSDLTANFYGDLTVAGDLTVSGTTTTLNTETVEVEDNILQLNTTQGSPDTATATTSGISIYRGDGVAQASFIFDDADDTWDLTNNLDVAGDVTVSGGDIIVSNAFTGVSGGSFRVKNSGETTIATFADNLDTTFAGTISSGSITATETNGGTINLRRDDTTISGTNTLGAILFQGDDPTDGTFNSGAAIFGTANGSWGSGSYPGNLEFKTRDTTGSLVTALTLSRTQNASFAGDVTVNGGKIVITESSTNNELFVMNASSDAYADQIWADNGGSLRLRNDGGAFKLYTGGTANSTTASGATEAFTIDASQDATFAGDATFTGDVIGASFAVPSGASTGFLKADGSIDSTTYSGYTFGSNDLTFSGTDPGDIVWRNGDGDEVHRIWSGSNDYLTYRNDAGTAYGIIHEGFSGYNNGNWDTAYTHSQAAHAPANAEANVYSNATELLTGLNTLTNPIFTGGLSKKNSRYQDQITSEYPLGHYTPGETLFEIDPTWSNAELQSYFDTPNVSWDEVANAPGGYAIYINGSNGVGGPYSSGFPMIPIDEDATYYQECWIKNATSSTMGHYMGSADLEADLTFPDSGAGNPGSYGYWVMSNTSPGDTWTKVSGYITGHHASNTGAFETNATYFTPLALFNYTTPAAGTRACWISGWKVIRVDKVGNRIFQDDVQVKGKLEVHTLDTNTSSTTALVMNSNEVEKRTLGSRAFDSTSYLPLAGGTLTGSIKINEEGLIDFAKNTDVDGVEVVGQVATATYTAVFFDYVIKKGANVRAGIVYACHDGSNNVEFSETSTTDLGNTSDVALSVDISSGNMRLIADSASNDWSVKTLIRAI